MEFKPLNLVVDESWFTDEALNSERAFSEENIKGVFKEKILRPEACENLIQVAECLTPEWKPEDGDSYGAPEVRIHQLSTKLCITLGSAITDLLLPKFQKYYNGNYNPLYPSINDMFIIKYTKGEQEKIGNHYDERSRYSISIELSREEASMGFPMFEKEINTTQGEGLIFPGGCPLYQHEPKALVSKNRYALVLWIN